MVLCFFSNTKPDTVTAKGAKGAQLEALLAFSENDGKFQVDMANAPCHNPLVCCVGACFALEGCTACYARHAVLEAYGKGIEDYVCCQGYVPPICGFNPQTQCKGSWLGLCCEGCCCTVCSLSIARMHVMDIKNLQPDPMDYQIIQFSNCMQTLSCICHILAMIDDTFDSIALLVDVVADLVTASVAGCMMVQIDAEIKASKATPVVAHVVGPVRAAVPMSGQEGLGAPVDGKGMQDAEAPDCCTMEERE